MEIWQIIRLEAEVVSGTAGNQHLGLRWLDAHYNGYKSFIDNIVGRFVGLCISICTRMNSAKNLDTEVE